ncbi:MAG: aminopeptidase N C-terminal domain-containing protein [Rhodococcus sp. (in: high G+C Gram-positive bacteria)]|uniref:aminopeptidase N C-terminal domain-containing protein n=1 Tax=Rhodococcus sp. TaxID=1831 RepID=UPI002AD627EA|nr:aminopeptidase N C-terminal domain-containing protein [Rhodococcus sp. (in: high G+C Gram-positive bacteria)]
MPLGRGAATLIAEINRVRSELLSNPSPSLDSDLIEVYRGLLQDWQNDPAILAMMLSPPSEKYIGELEPQIDVEGVHYARNCVERKLARALEADILNLYEGMVLPARYSVSATDVAHRSLRNRAPAMLVTAGSSRGIDYAKIQLLAADNMTDELAAFRALVHSGDPGVVALKPELIENFYQKWRDEALVLNHWFGVQSTCPLKGTLEQVKELAQHEAFDAKNLNKLRALVGSFRNGNMFNFHDASGSGYRYLEAEICRLNSLNPQLAARFVGPLCKWKRFDERRSNLMRESLERLRSLDNLSKMFTKLLIKV